MAIDAWYYAVGEQQHGPVTMDQLRSMAANGSLRPQQLIWTEGMGNWEPAAKVNGLFAQPYAAAPFSPAPVVGYYTPQPGYVEYAGFWLRVGAAVIDWLILLIPNVFISLASGGFGTQRGRSADPQQALIGCFGTLVTIAIAWLYKALMESSSNQATLGKMAVGVKVTDLAGQRISFGQATGRHFAKILSAIILMIGYMMAGFTDRKQALHDMIAGTLVVRKSQ